MSVIGGAILVVSGVLFLARAGARPDGAPGRAGGVPLQRRRASAAQRAGRAERLRALARPDGGADHRELRLSHRASPGDARTPRFRRSWSERGDERGTHRVRAQSLVHRQRRRHRGDRDRRRASSALSGCRWRSQASGSAASGTRSAAPPASFAAHLPRETGRPGRLSDHAASRSSPQMLQGASAESIGRGATLALRCTMCHGARGLSQANTPNLAGQYPDRDLQAAARISKPARAPAPSWPRSSPSSATRTCAISPPITPICRASPIGPRGRRAAPQIVANGAPMRGHRALRRLSRRPRQQGRRGVARRAARGLSARPARGFRRRRPAQRHRRADAQRRARIDTGRNRCRQPVLRGPALAQDRVTAAPVRRAAPSRRSSAARRDAAGSGSPARRHPA